MRGVLVLFYFYLFVLLLFMGGYLFFVCCCFGGVFVGVLGGFYLGGEFLALFFLGDRVFSQFDFSVVVQCQTPGPSGR